MNPDNPQSPREQLEARLTALLLGEASADEAAELRAAIQNDPGLAELYHRLEETIHLVREAGPAPSAQSTPQPAPLKLSDDRRQKLLAQFKTVAPKEFARPQPRPHQRTRFDTLIEIAAVLVLVGVLAGMLLPALSRSKSRAMYAERAPAKLAGLEESDKHVPSGELAPPDHQPKEEPLSRSDIEAKKGDEQTPVPGLSGKLVPIYATPVLPQAQTPKQEIFLPSSNETLEVAKEQGQKVELQGLSTAAGENTQTAAPNVALSGGMGGSGGGGAGGRSSIFGNAEWIGMLDHPDVQHSSSNQFVGRYAYIATPPGNVDPATGLPVGSVATLNPATGLPISNNDANANTFYRNTTESNTRLPDAPVSGTYFAGINGQASAVPEAGAKLGDLDANAEKPGTSQPGQSNKLESDAAWRFSGGKPNVGWLGRVSQPSIEREKLAENITNLGDIQKVPILGGTGAAFNSSNKPDPVMVTNGIALSQLAQSESRFYMDLNRTPDSSGKPSTAEAPGRYTPPSIPVRTLNPSALSHDLEPLQVTAAAADKNLGEVTTGTTTRQLAELQLPNNAYEEKKRELDRLIQFRDQLASKAASNEVEKKMPATTKVETIDLATANSTQKSGLGERIKSAFTGNVVRSARIKVERDQTDVPSVNGQPSLSGIYDPYFVQTETEVIRSQVVLDKVIEKLNLNKNWGDKHGAGVPLQTSDTRQLLQKRLDLRPVPNTSLMDIRVTSDSPEEAATIANAVAATYQDYLREVRSKLAAGGVKSSEEQLNETDKRILLAKTELDRLQKESAGQQDDPSLPKKVVPPSIPQPEVQTSSNAFSTFSLNVSDVSFKLAAASLEKGVMPDPATVRSEEFINAFDYRDPAPPPGAPIGFAWERSQDPFAQNRDLLRFSVKTAAAGREAGRPLNLVLLLDNSGSMERADRVQIIHEALRVLATQLQPQDTLSVVTFARTPRLWVDGVPGSQAGDVAEKVTGLTPQGGTNLEDAMKLAYETALRHYLANGINRVVLLTDGAANLGNVDPSSLKQKVEANRKQGIALDCFGIGWEGYNDDLLEVLSRNGDGRYGFINTSEDAATGFAGQLAGALHVAAADVKVQVEFNPARVNSYRQIGYAKHQLTKQQFRDNTVDAAEIGAAESGNALYTVEVNPQGDGPLATVRVRYKVPGTEDYREQAWPVPYTGASAPLDKSSPAMRLSATASAFSEWLVSSPYAADVTPDQLLNYLGGVPDVYGADARPKKLEWMLRQARSIGGK